MQQAQNALIIHRIAARCRQAAKSKQNASPEEERGKSHNPDPWSAAQPANAYTNPYRAGEDTEIDDERSELEGEGGEHSRPIKGRQM